MGEEAEFSITETAGDDDGGDEHRRNPHRYSTMGESAP